MRITVNKVNRSPAGTIGIFFVVLLLACFMAFPILLIIVNAFKPLDELWVFPPKFYVVNPTLKNFKDMFIVMSSSWVPFLRYLFNTVFITAAGTAGNIILSSMCAYPLAKKNFPMKKLIFSLVVVSLMFNTTVTAIPNYVTMSFLGWIDTYQAIIVPAFASSLGLFLMKQFMESSIPDVLIEAARIDGCSQYGIFWRIAMPIVKPAWLTLMLLSVQSLWNLGDNSFILSEQYKTLSFALSQIVSGGIARAGISAAVTLFMMIVPIAIFILCQSNIIETMSTSGIKE